MSDLEEFNQGLTADIQADADVLKLVTVEAFFEVAGELLTEAGELDAASRAYCTGSYSRGPYQIDGHGGDPRDSDGILGLVLCDFDAGQSIRTINRDDADRLFQRLYRFLTASLDAGFREGLEETGDGFGVADLIATTWNSVEKVKLIVVTNADYRARTDADNLAEHDGRPITQSVWDVKRLKQFMEQGQARAELEIDFDGEFGGGVPLLKASEAGSSLESYLAVIPGAQLAAIYDKWGPRLLEANVRSFLQARSKVNRGIRDTIAFEPSMFFPYNNGLSATADAIEASRTSDGLMLLRATNLQIVNGGQTTASLHAARKAAPEQLNQVHVQMKLTIVPPENSEDVVPKISEFANTQNRVNAADFFANHPFHIRMEEFSRRVLAPAGSAGHRETKWFYERARGQYVDERGRRTLAERKKFDAEFPRGRFLTKTDLAKYENSWACRPEAVSLGAQKNFVEFAKDIGRRWHSEGKEFDALWFKRMIAKAIVFRATERIVSRSSWYLGGYRANIVTYAIAKVVFDAERRGMVVDLDAIWRQQDVSDSLRDALLVCGQAAQDVITNPPEGIRNNSEWAKKQPCWKWLSERTLDYGENFERALIAPLLADEAKRKARTDQAVDDGVGAEIRVHQLGADAWVEVRDWAAGRRILSPKEIGAIEICASMPRKLPSERQCIVALAALAKLREAGYEASFDS